MLKTYMCQCERWVWSPHGKAWIHRASGSSYCLKRPSFCDKCEDVLLANPEEVAVELSIPWVTPAKAAATYRDVEGQTKDNMLEDAKVKMKREGLTAAIAKDPIAYAQFTQAMRLECERLSVTWDKRHGCAKERGEAQPAATQLGALVAEARSLADRVETAVAHLSGEASDD